MTDNEIIKALECCIKAETRGDCEEMGCPASTKQGCQFYLRTDDDYENTIYIEILKDALDLINRQKAEIEEQDQAIIKVFDTFIENAPTVDIKTEVAMETIRYVEKHLRIKRKEIDIPFTSRDMRNYQCGAIDIIEYFEELVVELKNKYTKEGESE